MPPRRCAARSSASFARGPTHTHAASAPRALADRRALARGRRPALLRRRRRRRRACGTRGGATRRGGRPIADGVVHLPGVPLLKGGDPGANGLLLLLLLDLLADLTLHL